MRPISCIVAASILAAAATPASALENDVIETATTMAVAAGPVADRES